MNIAAGKIVATTLAMVSSATIERGGAIGRKRPLGVFHRNMTAPGAEAKALDNPLRGPTQHLELSIDPDRELLRSAENSVS